MTIETEAPADMDRFDIYFRGELLPDTSPQAARLILGRRFGMDEATLDRLFSGRPVRVKSRVDADKAGRYRAAFRQAGALVDIVPHGTPPPQPQTAIRPAPESPEPSVNQASDFELLPPRTGSLADCAPPVVPAHIGDISWMRLDAPGVSLDERPEAPQLEFDLSGLSMSEPGNFSLEDCAALQPPADLPDISHLGLTKEAGEKDKDG
jgi:hypothetical protein